MAAVARPGAQVGAHAPPRRRAYSGLHAAAHRGDTGQIAPGWWPAARRGRTPRRARPHALCTWPRSRGSARRSARWPKAGADLDLLENDRYDAVTIAAVADDEETLRVLLALGASAKQMTSRYDGTALIAAAHLGHDGVVRQLIAAGAPLDHVNNLHWTAVIESIVLGDGGARHQATLKALVDAGASLQLADRSGRDAAGAGADRGFQAMAQMLQQAGAR